MEALILKIRLKGKWKYIFPKKFLSAVTGKEATWSLCECGQEVANDGDLCEMCQFLMK